MNRNLAQVSGGERELRTYYLKPFDRACAASNPAIEGGSTALSFMSAYASYDGVPVVSSYRKLSSQLRIHTTQEVSFRYSHGDCTWSHSCCAPSGSAAVLCSCGCQLREEWQYPYYVTTDAGSPDLLMTWHYTCADRECVAKQTLENGLQMEMGGGTFTYLTLPGMPQCPCAYQWCCVL